MIMYGIRHAKTKQIFHFSIVSNGDADFCNSYAVEISPSIDVDYTKIWMTKDEAMAQKVIESPNKWYNAGFEHPMYHKSYIGRMEIFKIEMEIM